MEFKQKGITFVVVVALGIGAIALYKLWVRELSLTKNTASAIVTPAVTVVTALGRLEPLGRVIKVSAPTSVQGAKVAQLLVTEGSKVDIGQVIAILDNRSRLVAALDKAQQQVKVAQANLAKVKAGAKAGEISAQQAALARWQEELRGQNATYQVKLNGLLAQLEERKKTQQAKIDRLLAQMRNAQAEFTRYQQLYNQGAIQASLLESKRLAMETAIEQAKEAQASSDQTILTLQQQIKEARATQDGSVATLQQQINEAQATLNQIEQVRPVDVQQATAEVESARATVKQAQTDLELTYVSAPITGEVLKIQAQAGETIGSQGIVDLGQTDRMIVVAEVDESDIGKVRLGQSAIVTSEANAFAGELHGTVSHINQLIGKKNILNPDTGLDVDARVVEVQISLDPPDSVRVASLTYLKVVVKISI